MPPVASITEAENSLTSGEMNFIEGVYVDNAGIVLAAAFLPRLFSMLGFLDDGEFVSEKSRSEAVRLSNYFVFSGDSPGHTQPLTNLLCGIEATTLLPAAGEVPQAYRDAAKSMLQGMLQNWQIENTSIEGLRASFIERHGMLSRVEAGWKLVVNPKAIDVLLDRRPWSISLIKLQWMEQPIHVTWR